MPTDNLSSIDYCNAVLHGAPSGGDFPFRLIPFRLLGITEVKGLGLGLVLGVWSRVRVRIRVSVQFRVS